MSYNPHQKPAPNYKATSEYKAKEAQLIISLKFHYGPTLSEIPLDVAVDAMVKVWESCNPKPDSAADRGLMANRPRRVAPPKVAPPQTIYL
ncbi:MAG: hypothetical protein AAGB01_05435 [Cyanobacteria bacterium P01_F01_bin.42]